MRSWTRATYPLKILNFILAQPKDPNLKMSNIVLTVQRGGHAISGDQGAKAATGISLLSLLLGVAAAAAGAGEAAMGVIIRRGISANLVSALYHGPFEAQVRSDDDRPDQS